MCALRSRRNRSAALPSRVTKLECARPPGCDRCRDWPPLFIETEDNATLKAGYPPTGYCNQCGLLAIQIVTIGLDDRGPQ
jgi:hypothetical protein